MPGDDADVGQARHLVDDDPQPLGIVGRRRVGVAQPGLERPAAVEHERGDQLGDRRLLPRVLLAPRPAGA